MLNLQNKITLKFRLKAYHHYYLNRFVILLSKKLSKVQYIKISCASLPKTYERFTLLRSPHVDIKARDQFERITHNKVITLSFFTSEIDIKETVMQITSLMQSFALGLDISLVSTVKTT
jgi:small subunit ribosomal protein S10